MEVRFLRGTFQNSIIAERPKAAAGDRDERAGAFYVPVKIAAAMMSAHPVTVHRLIADGKLGRDSVEGQVCVNVTDIHGYVARADGIASRSA